MEDCIGLFHCDDLEEHLLVTITIGWIQLHVSILHLFQLVRGLGQVVGVALVGVCDGTCDLNPIELMNRGEDEFSHHCGDTRVHTEVVGEG